MHIFSLLSFLRNGKLIAGLDIFINNCHCINLSYNYLFYQFSGFLFALAIFLISFCTLFSVTHWMSRNEELAMKQTLWFKPQGKSLKRAISNHDHVANVYPNVVEDITTTNENVPNLIKVFSTELVKSPLKTDVNFRGNISYCGTRNPDAD